MGTTLTESLIDTNILVYANNRDSEFHSVCKSIVTDSIKGDVQAVIALQNLIELYAIITDKRRVERPLTPKKAKDLIEYYEGNGNIRIIAPLPQTLRTVIKLIDKHKPKSQSVFDYFLVATMLDNDVHSIYTANDKDFKHFKGISVINPLI